MNAFNAFYEDTDESKTPDDPTKFKILDDILPNGFIRIDGCNDNIIYDFPNYNNIIVKPNRTNPTYKICDVCFGFANYTCKNCKDKHNIYS